MTETCVVHVREPHDVNIGRPSEWGNPFVIGRDGTRPEVIEKFRKYFYANPALQARATMFLTGKRLGCWCKPKSCHGDVYVEFLESNQLDFS